MIAANRMNEDQAVYEFLGRMSEQHRMIEAAIAQYDAYANMVDPREPFYDDGEMWNQVGYNGTMGGGKGKPPLEFSGFANELELTQARQACRRMLTYSEFVKNGHALRVNYAVDSGFVFRAAPKAIPGSDRAPDTAKQKASTLQAFLDELLHENDWPCRQRETVLRCDRDGEAFRRRFRQPDGMTYFRFIEPWQVTSNGVPDAAQNPNIDFGIECKDGDAETPVRYYVKPDVTSAQPEPVEAEDVQHLKANVDLNVRRGIPLFFVARMNTIRTAKGLRNIGQKSELAAALAFTRSHKGASQAAAESFQSNAATNTFTNPITGAVVNAKQYGPGTIIDHSANTEYNALNIAEGIEEMIMGNEAGLRAIATAAGLPEFMLTSNASNGNYSSTMVAEGPAVRTFRAIQSMLKEADLELIEDAVEWAIECGRLDADILDVCEIQVELPQLATRDMDKEAAANRTYVDLGVLSRQTLASRLGLDYDQEQENIAQHKAENPEPQNANDAANKGALAGRMQQANTPEELRAVIEERYAAFVGDVKRNGGGE